MCEWVGCGGMNVVSGICSCAMMIKIEMGAKDEERGGVDGELRW